MKEAAAVNRIATRVAPFVTNSVIDALAKEVGFRPLQASNKNKKIQLLLGDLVADGRSRSTATKVIGSLIVEAHRRTVAGDAQMTGDDVDAVVADMRALGLAVAGLARQNWRDGLRPAIPPTTGSSTGQPPPTVSAARRHRYEDALSYIAELIDGQNCSPQQRGIALERIFYEVLVAERLQPTHGIVNPGEQIDHAFVLDGQHYLAECKWLEAPVGSPIVTAFSEKVSRKAEGTFGVVLSMSGFVANINDAVSRGARLNCVGLGHREFMMVLEGRTTFALCVREARSAASMGYSFYRAISASR